MAITVTLNGVNYSIPDNSETGWGTNVRSWIQAVSQHSLQKSGGVFTLTAEVDFGAAHGIKSLYIKSQTANPASGGSVRLARTDEIRWRDQANANDLELGVNSSDQLTWNGNPIVGSSALTSSRALQSNGSGVIEASSVTSTELGYVSGVTSAIQTQFNDHFADTSTHGVGEIVGTSEIQTISNKTFSDAVTLAEIATPSTPASGFAKLYAKSDNFLYQLDDAGVERKVGAGSGTGTKNYLTNGDFEASTTTGWSLFNTTLTSAKPTGSLTFTAASVTTFAATASSPLAGTYSLNTASSGAWSAGQGFISDAFTIEEEDRGQVLRLSMSFEIVSGSSNIDTSGTTSNTFTLWAYDVTNSLWTEMVGTYSMISVNGKLMAEVQLPTTCVSARIAVLCTTVSGGACSLNWDSLVFGPREIARGSVVTDWQSYTPIVGSVSGSVTNYTVTGFTRRVGGVSENRAVVKFTGAPGTWSGINVSLPSGQTIDTAKIPSTTAAESSLGVLSVFDSGTRVFIGGVIYNNTTTVRAYTADPVTSDATVSNLSPMTFASGDSISFEFSVPIQGWSSNSVISSDFGGRIITATASRVSTTQTLTGAATTELDFNQASPIDADTVGGWDYISKRYDVKESGWYVVTAALSFAAPAASNTGNLLFRVNSSTFLTQVFDYTTGVAFGINAVSPRRFFNAGDEIYLQIAHNSTLELLSTGTITGGSKIGIEKIQSPQTLMGGEVVAFAAQTDSGAAIGTSATDIVFDDELYDTHGAYNAATGVFTAPVAGRYQFNYRVAWSALALTSGERALAFLVNQSAANVDFGRTNGTGASNAPVVIGSCIRSMSRGDTFKIQALANQAGTLGTGSAYDSKFEGFKVN